MVRFFSHHLFVALFFVVANTGTARDSKQAPNSELEDELQAIDGELRELAQISLNSGVGPIGYRSMTFPSAEGKTSIKIDLGQEFRIDEIVLVPTLWRDIRSGFVSDGFPLAFDIRVGTADDEEGTLVAVIGEKSGWLPGIGPLVIPGSGETASWVKIETSLLGRRAFDGLYIFQLSEILIFDGEKNIALHKRVIPSTESLELDAWNRQNLVDGIVPYVMNAAKGLQSRALVAHGTGEPVIEIDLGRVLPLSGIRLHAADQSDTVPQAYPGDYGLPRRFRIEAAERADFSDVQVLLEGRIDSIYRAGPMMEWQFPETDCRYVRLVATEPYLSNEGQTGPSKIAFAEIELHSNGRNVALGKAVTSNFPPMGNTRSLSALTDGNNLYGEILPVRKWMNQLARRHELETRRPVVTAQLTERYGQQKINLNLMFWLAAVLIAGIGFLILYYRRRSRRQEVRIRERISANLHDSLGANLHAIGLLGDLAKEAVDEPEELIDTVERIRLLTERTARAARDCANMIEATDVCQDLVAEMKRDSMSF
ncbi:MAG: histidine kinase dimerization/phosphoacceptor domain-containing protein, partial [Akkermansiaceae bacterium]